MGSRVFCGEVLIHRKINYWAFCGTNGLGLTVNFEVNMVFVIFDALSSFFKHLNELFIISFHATGQLADDDSFWRRMCKIFGKGLLHAKSKWA